MNYFSLFFLNIFLVSSFSCHAAADAIVNEKKVPVLDQQVKDTLRNAIKTNNKAVVFEILETDPHLISRQSANGNTLLHYAYHYGHKSLAKSLIKKGADVRVTNNQGQTPINCYKKKNCFDTRPVLPEIYNIFINTKKK